jgi:hypothetical protein
MEVNTMGAGVALDDEKKERIKALLTTGKSKNVIAKEVGVSWASVDKVSKENPDELENLREDKKQKMIDNIWASLEDAQELGHSMIKEAKQGIRDIPLNQISTYYGTLYDKMALMNGESTANIGGGLVISIGIPDKAEE